MEYGHGTARIRTNDEPRALIEEEEMAKHVFILYGHPTNKQRMDIVFDWMSNLTTHDMQLKGPVYLARRP